MEWYDYRLNVSDSNSDLTLEGDHWYLEKIWSPSVYVENNYEPGTFDFDNYSPIMVMFKPNGYVRLRKR